MAKTDFEYNAEFEAEVRRVAEAVWGLIPGQCQPSYYPDDVHIQELDGIARLRDTTHLIMATTSTRLDKLKDDVKKLNAAESHEQKTSLSVTKWFICEKQLDAQHIDYGRRHHVTVLTLNQFRRRFFDSRKYLSLRRLNAFGSARDPHSDSITINDDTYVELPITLLNDKPAHSPMHFSDSRPSSLKEVVQCIKSGKIAILMAPFGSGKSITTRQIFLQLAEQHLKDESLPAPFALNLREHWGQKYADEILDRHARAIGYSPREDLTIAWRSGIANLLLDGFDEVASQTVIRKNDETFMRAARRDALSGVRDFITKIPAGIGVLICGRDHYFDDEQEISSALAVSGKSCKVFKLGEFTEEGVKEFLEKNGISTSLPDWLPRKPLLLGYLIHRKLIDEIIGIDGSSGFAHAWDTFLTKVTEREAELESSTMEAQTLRAVMERLALVVRERSSGNGPITGVDLSNAFSIETGQSAGEGVIAQLQRLPGLTQREQDPGARSFVDEDMLAALQGSAFYRLLLENFKSSNALPIAALSPKAVGMAAYLLLREGYSSSTLVSVLLSLARQKEEIKGQQQILSDLVMVTIAVASVEGYSYVDFNNLVVDSGIFDKINFEEMSLRHIVFKECMISEVVIDSDGMKNGAVFVDCWINKILGIADESGLPKEMFVTTKIEKFDNMATTSAVLQLNMQPQLKALITILRKLYKQAGGGRQMNALFRGITQKSVLDYIERIVGELESEGLVFITSGIVHPVRKQSGRVDRILVAPSLSVDPIVSKVLGL